MSTILHSITPIWKVLVVGLILGAGLPALFALGIRASAGTSTADGSVLAPSPGGRLAAGAAFLVVGLVVVAAVVLLASSKAFLARFGLS